jgi:hypothetical protein
MKYVGPCNSKEGLSLCSRSIAIWYCLVAYKYRNNVTEIHLRFEIGMTNLSAKAGQNVGLKNLMVKNW